MNTQAHQTVSHDAVILPLPPQISCAGDDMEIYGRFMRYLRHVPNSRMDIKILSAIQFTADMMNYSDAQVAKMLVDMGLRGPRMAFPADFLTYADAALMRSGWEVGGPTAGLMDLKSHWDRTGEDKFAAFRGDFPLLDERIHF